MDSPKERGAKPRCDDVNRELSYDGKLAKRFRQPAKNQVLILKVFHEEDWPSRIDDPLSPQGGALASKDDTKCKIRLRDTIAGLNARLTGLRFLGDGTGYGRALAPYVSIRLRWCP